MLMIIPFIKHVTITHSAGQSQDCDHVLSQLVVKQSISSKPRAPTSVILRDCIVKNVYSNIITKSVKRQDGVIVKQFSGAKIVDMDRYKKPTQEKLPEEIYVGRNGLSSDKGPKDIANDIM